MRRDKPKYIFILVLALTLLGCSKQAENAMDDKLKNSWFAMCYTPEFAKRFSLPLEKAIPLDKGLYAIALEVRPAAGSYHTYIHLYIDNRLDVYTPDSKCNFFERGKPAYFFVKEYNDSRDHDWILNASDKNSRRMMFQSQSLHQSDKGVVESLQYQSVRKAFLPGMSLLSMQIGKSYLDMRHGPGEVLVQKNNVGDYLLEYEDSVNPKHPENYYTFNIPEKLQNQVQPFLKHIYTKIIRSEPANYRDPVVEFP